MSLAVIRTEIKDVIEDITNIGVVHDYERLTTDWKAFLDKFKPSGRSYIRGWTIRREKTPEGVDPSAMGYGHREYYFKIRGYMSLDDANASSKTFDGLIEDICDAFRPLTDNKLNRKADISGFIQVDIVEDRMFGSVLCHFCELSISIIERVVI